MGLENQTCDGDGSAAVSVDHWAGDGADPEGDPDQDGWDEGHWTSALAENVHKLDQEGAEGVGDSISWK